MSQGFASAVTALVGVVGFCLGVISHMILWLTSQEKQQRSHEAKFLHARLILQLQVREDLASSREAWSLPTNSLCERLSPWFRLIVPAIVLLVGVVGFGVGLPLQIMDTVDKYSNKAS